MEVPSYKMISSCKRRSLNSYTLMQKVEAVLLYQKLKIVSDVSRILKMSPSTLRGWIKCSNEILKQAKVFRILEEAEQSVIEKYLSIQDVNKKKSNRWMMDATPEQEMINGVFDFSMNSSVRNAIYPQSNFNKIIEQDMINGAFDLSMNSPVRNAIYPQSNFNKIIEQDMFNGAFDLSMNFPVRNIVYPQSNFNKIIEQEMINGVFDLSMNSPVRNAVYPQPNFNKIIEQEKMMLPLDLSKSSPINSATSPQLDPALCFLEKLIPEQITMFSPYNYNMASQKIHSNKALPTEIEEAWYNAERFYDWCQTTLSSEKLHLLRGIIDEYVSATKNKVLELNYPSGIRSEVLEPEVKIKITEEILKF